ncbi:hypothetical protein COLO4_23492 [Corchorus olitorius]|uniref:Uncharacterized protein n=1 Tax=Corchorus olitorius TaxID=93759 RepID=A0A1R3IG92_9ROSI|nr:hypothetical protein COLO4_23492 [Corchorus olitorius]
MYPYRLGGQSSTVRRQQAKRIQSDFLSFPISRQVLKFFKFQRDGVGIDRGRQTQCQEKKKEMLCEDRGFFLEIADVIRGFGLNILKGLMELQEDKIWARFMVEANEQVGRTYIIWSLLLLLQQIGTSGIDSANHPNRAMDGGISLPNNF